MRHGLQAIGRRLLRERGRGCGLALACVISAVVMGWHAAPADAQDRGDGRAAGPVVEGAGEGAGEAGMVALNLPEELELKVLVDYVSKRDKINFVFDGNILDQTVKLKAPHKIPASAMRPLLESVLKMKGLMVTETEVAGLFRIERVQNLPQVAVGPGEEGGPADVKGPLTAVSRLFTLENTTSARVMQLVSPLLSQPGGSLTVLEEQDLVLVTDFANAMPRIERMFALLNRPGKQARLEFVAAEHLAAAELARKTEELLKAQAKVAGGQQAAEVSLIADDRTNRIAVIGLEAEVEEALALIALLDRSLGLETRIYRFDIADPERIDELTESLIGEVAADRLYKSVTDSDARLLVATATPEIHEQIEALREELDVATAQSPVRFYKLENAKATDVLTLLRDIEGERGLAGVSVDGVAVDANGGAGDRAETGDGRRSAIAGPTEAQVNRRGDGDTEAGAGRRSEGGAVELPDARVLADDQTNTIIVVAEPAVHRVYERLIERLDVRRPQVLIEATIVTLDTTDDFSLGVEIFSGEQANGGQLLNFTQFGLSASGSQPGSVTLNPGTGFTGALLDANVAEVVIRALESDQRARVVSQPSVLVNDNATGSLVSEQEEPFETVSVSETSVERTSFGGFASAGTNIEITPQISEGDHLNLEYSITLSSFNQEGSAATTLPPARQTNTLSSVATIPDGHTIVVGGLTRDSFSNNVDRVPLLGRIPVLEYLFSSRSETRSQDTLFVFLHAVILRDDKFEDLKILSGEAAAAADIAGDFPESEPVEIP